MSQRRMVPSTLPGCDCVDSGGVGAETNAHTHRISQFRSLSCLTVMLNLMVVGAVHGWTTCALHRLTSESGGVSQMLTNDEASWMVPLTVLGSMIGSLVASQLCDRFGRKNCLVFCNTIFMLGWFIIFVESSNQNIVLLYIIRFCHGISIGIVHKMHPIYISEIENIEMRHAILSQNILFVFAGTLFSASLGFWITHQAHLVFLLLMSFISLLLNIYIPETPYCLMIEGRLKEALQATKYYKGVVERTEVRIAIRAKRRQEKYGLHQGTKYGHLPTRHNLRYHPSEHEQSGSDLSLESYNDLESQSRSCLPTSSSSNLRSSFSSNLPSPSRRGLPSPSRRGLPSPSRRGLPSPSRRGLPSPSRRGLPSPSRRGLSPSSRKGLPPPFGRTLSPPPRRRLHSTSRKGLSSSYRRGFSSRFTRGLSLPPRRNLPSPSTRGLSSPPGRGVLTSTTRGFRTSSVPDVRSDAIWEVEDTETMSNLHFSSSSDSDSQSKSIMHSEVICEVHAESTGELRLLPSRDSQELPTQPTHELHPQSTSDLPLPSTSDLASPSTSDLPSPSRTAIILKEKGAVFYKSRSDSPSPSRSDIPSPSRPAIILEEKEAVFDKSRIHLFLKSRSDLPSPSKRALVLREKRAKFLQSISDSLSPPRSDLPSASRSDLPSASRSDLPLPSTSDLPLPSTSDLPLPSTSDLPLPSTSDLPSPSTSDLPSPSRSDLPSASRSDLPSASRSDLPSASRSDLPSASRSDLPSPSRTAIILQEDTAIFIPSRSDIPSPSRIDLPSSSRIDLPSSSRKDLSSSSRKDLPSSPRKDLPSSSKKDLPSPSRSKLPLPFRSDFPSTSRSGLSTPTGKELPSTPRSAFSTPSGKNLTSSSRKDLQSKRDLPPESRSALHRQSNVPSTKSTDIDDYNVDDDSTDTIQISWSSKLQDILQGTNRKALFIMFGLIMAQHLSGNFITMQYLAVFFNNTRLNIGTYLATILVLTARVLSGTLSTLSLQAFGRLTIMMVSTFGVCFTLCILSIYLYLDAHEFDVSKVTYIPPIVIGVYQIMYQLGLGIIPNVLLCELFLSELQDAVSIITVIFDGIIGFTVSKLYQVITDIQGSHVIYITFTVSSFFALAMVSLCMPETKGKTYYEIEAYLHGKDFESSKLGIVIDRREIHKL